MAEKQYGGFFFFFFNQELLAVRAVFFDKKYFEKLKMAVKSKLRISLPIF
jgi:hypothetical protein